jgi:hypothetical protein
MRILKLKFSILEKEKRRFQKLFSLKKNNNAPSLETALPEFDCKVCLQGDTYFLVLNSQLTPIQSGDSVRQGLYHVQFEVETGFPPDNRRPIFSKDPDQESYYPLVQPPQKADPLGFLYENLGYSSPLSPSTTRLLSNQEGKNQKKTKLL